MTGVHVAGVGIHPFGRFEDRTITDMGVMAVRAALAEAGIAKGGFQAAFCATAYGGVASGHKVLSRLGMTGMPIVDVEAGCASGGRRSCWALVPSAPAPTTPCWCSGSRRCPRASSARHSSNLGRKKRDWRPHRPTSRCAPNASCARPG